MGLMQALVVGLPTVFEWQLAALTQVIVWLSEYSPTEQILTHSLMEGSPKRGKVHSVAQVWVALSPNVPLLQYVVQLLVALSAYYPRLHLLTQVLVVADR